jgi:hypothetical protein
MRRFSRTERGEGRPPGRSRRPHPSPRCARAPRGARGCGLRSAPALKGHTDKTAQSPEQSGATPPATVQRLRRAAQQPSAQFGVGTGARHGLLLRAAAEDGARVADARDEELLPRRPPGHVAVTWRSRGGHEGLTRRKKQGVQAVLEGEGEDARAVCPISADRRTRTRVAAGRHLRAALQHDRAGRAALLNDRRAQRVC